MPEAVIVDTLRTPIGRAFKGSLAQLRPDETGAFVIDQLLERNPDVDPALIQDVICGVGMPQGLQGFNIARIMVLLSEKLGEETTGVTVSRYCASSLDAIRHASNAVKNGEGDAYIAAGVEFVSRFNERSEVAGAATTRTRSSPASTRATRTSTSTWASPPSTSPRSTASPATTWTTTPCAPSTSRSSPRRPASSIARSSPVDTPERHEVSKDDGPRKDEGDMREKLGSLKEAFGGGGVTAGNSCPLNDGAAAVLIMSDTKAKELGLKPRARIITAATAGNNPEYMGVAPIPRPQEGPRPGRHDHRRRRRG